MNKKTTETHSEIRLPDTLNQDFTEKQKPNKKKTIVKRSTKVQKKKKNTNEKTKKKTG